MPPLWHGGSHTVSCVAKYKQNFQFRASTQPTTVIPHRNYSNTTPQMYSRQVDCQCKCRKCTYILTLSSTVITSKRITAVTYTIPTSTTILAWWVTLLRHCKLCDQTQAKFLNSKHPLPHTTDKHEWIHCCLSQSLLYHPPSLSLHHSTYTPFVPLFSMFLCVLLSPYHALNLLHLHIWQGECKGTPSILRNLFGSLVTVGTKYLITKIDKNQSNQRKHCLSISVITARTCTQHTPPATNTHTHTHTPTQAHVIRRQSVPTDHR